MNESPLTREELARFEAAVDSLATIAQVLGNLFSQLSGPLVAALKEIEEVGKRS